VPDGFFSAGPVGQNFSDLALPYRMRIERGLSTR